MTRLLKMLQDGLVGFLDVNTLVVANFFSEKTLFINGTDQFSVFGNHTVFKTSLVINLKKE